MRDDKRDDHGPTTITLTPEMLQTLVAAEAAKAVKAAMGQLESRSADDLFQAQHDRDRGIGRPLAPETLVPCTSPLTGSTFTARTVSSRAYPSGRVMELLDYQRPTGWDVHRDNGGLYDGVPEDLIPVPTTGKVPVKFAKWVFQTFWQTDANALLGKPGSSLSQWRRVTEAVAAAE
jgi:hypothetical protein